MTHDAWLLLAVASTPFFLVGYLLSVPDALSYVLLLSVVVHVCRGDGYVEIAIDCFSLLAMVITETMLDLRSMDRLKRSVIFAVVFMAMYPVCFYYSARPVECLLTCMFASASFTGHWVLVSSKEYTIAEQALLDIELSKYPHLSGAISRVAGLNTLSVTSSKSSSCADDKNTSAKCAAAAISKDRKKGLQVQKEILVLLHGYGGGNVLWAQSFSILAAKYDVHCVELPGMGNSDRPNWQHWEPNQVLNQFQEKLELWRQTMGIGSFVLLGHSLGALAASSYTVRYNNRVSSLVLVSPVGVAPRSSKTPLNHGPSRMLTGSFLARFGGWLWEQHLGPLDLLRAFGPLAHTAISTVLDSKVNRSSGRSHLRKASKEDLALTCAYLHQNWCQKPSGERAITVLLAPGAWPRLPLCNWLRVAGHTSGHSSFNGFDEGALSHLGPGIGKDCSVSFIYGDPKNDWMDKSGGDELAADLRRQGCKAQCTFVHDAGHLVNLDQPYTFAEMVLQVLNEK